MDTIARHIADRDRTDRPVAVRKVTNVPATARPMADCGSGWYHLAAIEADRKESPRK